MTTLNGSRPDDAPAASAEAEQAVLGAAIRDPNALGWLATHLRTDDFYGKANRSIAGLLLELHRDGMPVEPGVLLTILRERDILADLGGASYLHDLDAAAETPASVGWYGRKVLDASRMRQTQALVAELAQACREPGWDAGRIAALAIDQFQQLLDNDQADGVGGPPELLDSLRETRDRRRRGDKVSWHLENLDALTGGMEPGQMIVVAGRPGSGKSSLGLQVAARVGEGRRTLFVSYEMTRSQIARRNLAMYAHVSTDTAVMKVDDDRLAGARLQYEGVDMTFIDSRPDLDRLLAQIRGLHAQRSFDLIVVDYLQLIPVDSRRYTNREQEVAAISRGLKLLAGRLDVPVMPLAQLNRNADGREPNLSDLRESGQIEQDADVVVFLHEDGPLVKAIVAKNRDGGTGWKPLRFDKPRTTFSDDGPPPPGWKDTRDPSHTR